MKNSERYSRVRFLQRVLARAVICCMVLVLPSCGIPKLRPLEPAAPMPPDFVGPVCPAPDQPADCTAASSAQVSIQEFYQDPLLLGLIEQGLANNRELKILNEEVQVARAEIMLRRGRYLPFVTLGASAGVEKPSLFTPLGAVEDQLDYFPGRAFPDPLPNFLGSFNLFWQIDIWRELRNARDAAIQRYVAAVQRRNYFQTQMVAEIAENYYRLMALDNRIVVLNRTIALQEQSLKLSRALKDAGRATELAVQRFMAEVRKNQSEKPIIMQEIIEVENRINFLVNRYPQPVERVSTGYLDLTVHPLALGVPAQLLENRTDIRQAERELVAAGLDIRVARAHFFPRLDISAGVGYQAFNPKYLFQTPDALIYNAAGNLVAPLLNKSAIRAEYLSANAKQLQAVYNYQRVILNAFTEVINRMAMVQNYSNAIDIKKQQLISLEASVDVASKLFQNARVEYVDVLLAQRDLQDARMVILETKQQQLSAIVNTYQALGGGLYFAPSVQLPPLLPAPGEDGAPVEELPQPKPVDPPENE